MNADFAKLTFRSSEDPVFCIGYLKTDRGQVVCCDDGWHYYYQSYVEVKNVVIQIWQLFLSEKFSKLS